MTDLDRPPSQGFRDGPVMPHGSVTTNVAVDFEALQIRHRASQRRGAQRIAASTQPGDQKVLSIEHGDLLFRMPGTEARMINVPKSVPRALVSAAFNLLTEQEANNAIFIGVARNRVRPNQGQNLDNPVLACVVHGMISTINNGPDTFEAGDIVIALPPDCEEADRQLGDPRRGVVPKLVSTTGIPGHRAVAVTVPLHSSYSIFFDKSTNSIPRAFAIYYAERVPAANRAELDAVGGQMTQFSTVGAGARASVGAMIAGAMRLETSAHRNARPFTCLQPYLYAEVQQVAHDTGYALYGAFAAQPVANANEAQAAVTQTAQQTFDDLVRRLSQMPVFQRYATYAFGTNIEAEIAAQLVRMVNVFPVYVKATMLLNQLIIDHVDFMRTFYRTKTVGKAMAQAPRNSILHVYVNPGV